MHNSAEAHHYSTMKGRASLKGGRADSFHPRLAMCAAVAVLLLTAAKLTGLLGCSCDASQPAARTQNRHMLVPTASSSSVQQQQHPSISAAGTAGLQGTLDEPPHLRQLLPELASNVTQLAGSRRTSIKVGVLNPEARPKDELFIEFDPTVPAHHSPHQVILPFVAAPFAVEEVAFYIHTWGGCSSTLIPRGAFTDWASYREEAVAMCEEVVKTQPPAQWKGNDYTYPNEEAFRAGFSGSASSCFYCQAVGSITGIRRFKAVALAEVVELLPQVELLDIDAQGLDVALLLSLGQQMSKVRRIKIECQTDGRYLYHNRFNGARVAENSCDDAEAFVRQYGHTCRRELNNCACGEVNLYCSRGDGPAAS